MLAKFKIQKINPERRPFEKVVYVLKQNKPHPVITVVQPFLCEVGDDLGIISKGNSNFIVINKRNEVFFIKHEEIEFTGNIQTEMNFKNRVPKFIDFIEAEEFSLDLL